MASATKIQIPYRTMWINPPDPNEHTSNPGTGGIEEEWGYDINNEGRKIIVKTGEKNLYAEIQSHKEECLIENILKRVAAGDMSDFRPNGIYADMTEIPTNLIDSQKAIMKLSNFWNSQNQEVRNKYNNDINEFIAKAGTKAWGIDVGLIQPEVEPEPTPVIQAPNTTVDTPKNE